MKNCLVTEGCEVFGKVSHSVLFSGVTVMEGAVVEDSIVMPNAVVERGAVVRRAIIAENAVVGAGAIVGETDGGDRRGRAIPFTWKPGRKSNRVSSIGGEAE